MEVLATWLRDQCRVHGADCEYVVAIRRLVIRTRVGRVWEFQYLEAAGTWASNVWGVSPPREVVS